MNLDDGLDFILSHFPKDTLWPRKISTKATDNHQRLVYSKEEALAWFKLRNYLDCRISAYPPVDASPTHHRSYYNNDRLGPV